MRKDNVYFIPEKTIKIHKIFEEQENCMSGYQHNPACIEEILYFASRCLEIKRNLGQLLKEDYVDLKDRTN